MCLLGHWWLGLHGGENGFREALCSARSADIAGQELALGKDFFECGLDQLCSLRLVDVVEHEDRRLQKRGRIRLILSGDIGCTSMDGLEDGAIGAEVRTRYETKAAYEGGAEV